MSVVAGPGMGQERPAWRERDEAGEVCAALDLGTSNCRLLIARPAPQGFRVVDSFSRIVRLGEGLAASGRLSEAAMARTLEALRICAHKMRHHKVTLGRAVATAACRRADNCDGFLERVRAETGLDLEIISGDEEASLALYGCAPLLNRSVPRAIVFDIGGGSTEVTWLRLDGEADGDGRDALDIIDWLSLPLGVISLAERYGGGRLQAEIYRAMVGEVRQALERFEARHQVGKAVSEGRVQMLGTSGTVTTLAAVRHGLRRYDRRRVDGCRLGLDPVRETIDRICEMSYEQRLAHPCIGPNRADLVVAGCAILDALCGLWPVGSLRVADRGLREGILFHLMNAPDRADAQPGPAAG